MQRVFAIGVALLLAVAWPAWAEGDTSLRGTLLIAAADMDGTPFARTVILVIDHGHDGAFGLVLNRRTRLSLSDVLPSEIEAGGPRDYPLHTGGPVRPRELGLLLRSANPPAGMDRVLPEIAYAPSAKLFDRALDAAPAAGDVRVFTGYSAWAPGQLEAEIERGDWHIVPAEATAVFGEPGEALWRRLIRRIGIPPPGLQST